MARTARVAIVMKLRRAVMDLKTELIRLHSREKEISDAAFTRLYKIVDEIDRVAREIEELYG